MKAVRVLLFAYCAFLLIFSGCQGIPNSGNQMSPGMPPSTGGSAGGSGGGSSPSSPMGFLYVIENPNAASTVEGFSVSNTGALTHVSSTNASFNAADIAADSQFVFVGHSPLGQTPRPPIELISYSIGSSGNLTTAGQVSFSNADDTMSSMLLTPFANQLFVSSIAAFTSGRASTFAVNNSSGQMTVQTDFVTLPFRRMAMSPNFLFVYAATNPRPQSADAPGIELLMRDRTTGVLTDSGRIFHGAQPAIDQYSEFAFSSGGQFLLALDPGHKITVFSINSQTGDLSFASELSGNFLGLTVDTPANFAVVTDANGMVVSYRINTLDGTLSLLNVGIAAPGIRMVAMDSTNLFVYALNSATNQIFGFTVDPFQGVLIPISGSPFATAGQPIRMAAVGR